MACITASLFHLSLPELGPAVNPCLPRVGRPTLDHLIEQVDADGSPGRSHLVRRQDRVDPATAAEIDHGLPGSKLGVRDRVPDPESPRGADSLMLNSSPRTSALPMLRARTY